MLPEVEEFNKVKNELTITTLVFIAIFLYIIPMIIISEAARYGFYISSYISSFLILELIYVAIVLIAFHLLNKFNSKFGLILQIVIGTPLLFFVWPVTQIYVVIVGEYRDLFVLFFVHAFIIALLYVGYTKQLEVSEAIKNDLYSKEKQGVDTLDLREYASEIGLPFEIARKLVKGIIKKKEVIGYLDEDTSTLYLGEKAKEIKQREVTVTPIAETPPMAMEPVSKEPEKIEEEFVSPVMDKERIERALEKLEEKFKAGEVDEVTYYKLKAEYLEKLKKLSEGN